ncbi:NAD(P)-binding protein [Pseudoxanthobacter sp. M-2]|uniref:NAD(P)/FAD-dependent oxidoreductase n=1 Tax=Pseudoxanthobacter sp. M-2 TaxID=3078754 RepID=UPI0038FD0CDD
MTTRVAIIGAGMAGLAAARRLTAAGIEPVIFDKSRGLGGRMATRRVDGLQFDHGVQYFTAKGLRFSALVEDWCVERMVGEWFDGGFVGTPAMTAPARAMADGLTVVGGRAVTALERGASGWTVFNSAGVADAPDNGAFSAVVLAVPAPQAVPIAATAGVALPQLAAVRYAPCWALMLAFETPLSVDWDHLRPHDGPLAWVARNGTKLGRRGGRETLVVHAGADWSRRNLEATQETVAALLEPHWRAATGITSTPTFAAAHRWRYARVEETAGSPFLWDKSSRLGACGDWCLGPRVEAAFDSGEAMADAVVAGLEVGRAA